MHQKLFGGWAPPGPAGRWGSSQTSPDLVTACRILRAGEERGQRGRGRDGEKVTGDNVGWGGDRRKVERKDRWGSAPPETKSWLRHCHCHL